MTGERARRIETPDDVLTVLESGHATFREWIDCIETSRRHHRWDLVDRVGHEVLRDVVANPATRIPTLEEAVRSVAKAYIDRVAQLEDLSAAAASAIAALQSARHEVPGSTMASNALDGEIDWLDELRLLASDPSPPTLTKLCRRLREIDRSDLGADAARRALSQEPGSVPAMTTLAAALLDQGRADVAIATISKAWDLDPSSYVANTFSRALLANGQHEEAYNMAHRAFELDPGPVSQHTLLAAAAASSDPAAIEDAQALISRCGTGGGGNDLRDRRYVELLAAEALVESGRLDDAEVMVNQLLADPEGWKARIEQLRNRIRYLRRKQQGELGFG